MLEIRFGWLVILSSWGLAAHVVADDALPPPSSDPVLPMPRDRDFSWMSLAEWKARHADDVAIAKRGGVDLLFIGDSIMQGADENPDWQRTFAPYRSANFGIGGDRTQNVLWRLEHGDVGTLKPRLVVLLIGTNNIGTTGNDGEDTARGIVAVVATLRASFPASRVLVLGVFPREHSAASPVRTTVAKINASVASLDDGKSVFVRDIGRVFLEADGAMTLEISPDGVHLTPEGYRRWAGALAPIVRELMR